MISETNPNNNLMMKQTGLSKDIIYQLRVRVSWRCKLQTISVPASPQTCPHFHSSLEQALWSMIMINMMIMMTLIMITTIILGHHYHDSYKNNISKKNLNPHKNSHLTASMMSSGMSSMGLIRQIPQLASVSWGNFIFLSGSRLMIYNFKCIYVAFFK